MKNLIKKDFLNLVMVALPFIYLGSIYGGLPAEVPVHWDGNGEIDRMGSKVELWIIPFLLPLLTYIILSAVPALDPKKKLRKMGGKYQSLKTMVVALLSMMALYIIYVAKNPEMMRTSVVVILIGLLFMGLGNFFKTIQPNYFVGIKTPWTLENETVWKRTHQFSGMLWLGGGMILIVASMLLSSMASAILLLIIALAAGLLPVWYSWSLFKKIG